MNARLLGKKQSLTTDEYLTGYLEDFFYALTFPNAFDVQSMPPQWEEAMKVISLEYHTIKHYLGMGIGKKGV